MTNCLQNYRVIILLSLVLIFPGYPVLASWEIQESDSTQMFIRLAPQFGLVIPHHDDMFYFIHDYSYGLDMNFGITKYNRIWYQYLNYPELGFGLFYNTYGNEEIYGHGISTYGYIQSNIIRSRLFNLRSKVALGLGYVNNPYRVDKNPYNLVFGSSMNVFINFALLARYKIARRWAITGNLSLNHLSNGAIKKPNHGINTVTMGIGIDYLLNNAYEPEVTTAVRAPRSNSRDLIFFFSMGRSQRSQYVPVNYPAFTINANHLWWISKKTAWGIGVDAIYYGAAPYEYSENDNEFAKGEENYSEKDKLYGGLFGSYNFRFNNTQIFAHVGVFLLYTIPPLQRLYPRVGVRQRIYKNLYGNFSIKASFFKAEFIEFGLGYRINYKKNTL